MDAAYISAVAALAGSAIGALASLATTWLTQHAQARATRFAQEMDRRERLYGEFIDEASRLLADALTHHLEEPSKMVPLYAITGKLRLFASANVVARADEVMTQIVQIYDLPNADFRNPADRPTQDRVDILRAFSEACRGDLQQRNNGTEPADVTLEVNARIGTTRDRSATAHPEEGKLGLDHFEGRSWQGLHRHALRTMIAYAFLQYRRLTTVRQEKKNQRATTSTKLTSRTPRHPRSRHSIASAIPVLPTIDR